MFVFEQVFEPVLIVPVVFEVPVVPNMLLTLPESLHIHRNLRVITANNIPTNGIFESNASIAITA